MTKALIIVESPTKIKTLKKFLGPKYHFESSVGHIRDLPQKGFGIDVENDFEPKYENLPDKKEVIARLKKAAKDVDIVYLAPDPDREGEAIAWHISEILPKDVKYKRMTFNAITKDAVLEALRHPRDIDHSLVDAQQARRLLDRIVGYKISPILTRRVQGAKDGGLSAGRVQSIALKLVVDREKEIQVFVPVEYWNIDALLEPKKSGNSFSAYVHSVDGLKVEKQAIEGKEVYLIPNQQTSDDILKRLEKATYKVASVDQKEKRRNPVAPFITSSLQQEASRHYGFSASRTMTVAQSLYEGVELGQEGAEGLITYMRTDSVRVAPEAIDAARNFIVKEYGKPYLPDQPRMFATKKSSQDAHEAIRPTNIQNSPEKIRNHLNPDQFKLYQLIWRRFIASQMNPAIYDTVSCDIVTNNDILLRATGSIIKFQGFLIAYQEKQDRGEEEKEEDRILPPLSVGDMLNLLKTNSEQSFTKPPPRYTEASLIKELERLGIGRPSTFVAIMNKIQSRDYTVKEKGTLKPTELGIVIAQMLEENFKMIMDIGFTASMEDELELVEEHKRNWKDLIRQFWQEFIPYVESAEKDAFVPKIMTDIDCPNCGHKLQKIWSRKKYFYGCSNYPECTFTGPIEALEFKKEDYDPNFDWDQPCPKCKSKMVLRFGKFGAFLGCSTYPECRGIVNIPRVGEKTTEEMPDCVAIGCDGKLTARRSRFGKVFYSCTNFPECDVIVNDLSQLEEKYPNHPKTPYQKKIKEKKGAMAKETGKAKKSTKTKKTKKAPASLKKVSKPLEKILGVSEISPPEAIKGIWDYIKKNDLQDKKDKRLVVPDENLAKVFGSKEKIHMMKMTKKIYENLS